MKTRLKSKLQKTAVAAVFVCALSAIAQISILTPIGVPLTFQVFGVAVCGYTLGVKWGVGAVSAYILLGTVGLPVFSNFRGGPQMLFGASGGFIFGFLALAVFCGIFRQGGFSLKLLGGLLGLLLCHLCGVLQLKLVSSISFAAAFVGGSLPFILKDLLCVLAAVFLSKRIGGIFKMKMLTKNSHI